MTLAIPFDNSYTALPEQLFRRVEPTPVTRPELIAVNDDLARELGIDPDALRSPEGLAVLAGNAIANGSDPIAQAYGGHQFGQWNPALGDGRAILLGEVRDQSGKRRDIALKGSGPTPFSRRGDGRAWLGPVLREYLMSEAMHALGVPTTRALAAVLTGETVVREAYYPGAVFTRVADSHIRVGTFQLLAARRDVDGLKALADHVIARHYPETNGPSDLLRAITKAQAELIAHWISIGFIHGVMNTDNMTVSGETIDYGPCAFMDGYHPSTVFSSIDTQGRYAYGNQPQIAVWNIAQLATSLVPLMPDQEAALDEFTEIVNSFGDLYQAASRRRMAAKIGLQDNDQSFDLVNRLLTLMRDGGSDFTNTFAALGTPTAQDQFTDRDAYKAWEADWNSAGPNVQLMAEVNPVVIPRLHKIEAVIQSGLMGDFTPFHEMLEVVTAPFAPLNPVRELYARPPTSAEAVTRTFCGT